MKAPQKFLRYALAVVLIASGTTLIAKDFDAGVVIPAIGISAIMVGALFAAQVFTGRGRGGRSTAKPAGASA